MSFSSFFKTCCVIFPWTDKNRLWGKVTMLSVSSVIELTGWSCMLRLLTLFDVTVRRYGMRVELTFVLMRKPETGWARS